MLEHSLFYPELTRNVTRSKRYMNGEYLRREC